MNNVDHSFGNNNVAAYVRSSMENSTAVERQIDEIEEYLDAHDIICFSFYEEAGKQISENMVNLWIEKYRGTGTVIYVTGLNRLGRDMNYVDAVRRRLKDAGINIHSLDDEEEDL
ncbi:MAG: recombinase family protein [Lachnospiraceae bacterium]